MRILILTFYFEPDLSAGSFRMSGLVKALHGLLSPDDHVEVLTTQPNRYASYTKEAAGDEDWGQIAIRRFALPPHQSGFADQLRAFVSYARQVLKATHGAKYDLVFATSSRLFTGWLGAVVARRARAVLYLDIRDIFVDTMNDVLPPLGARLLLPVLRQVEKWTVTRAAQVNLVSEGFRDYFASRYPALRYSVIENGIDDVFLESALGQQQTSEKLVVLYAGNIGEGQGLPKIIPGLASALRRSHEFWIVGDGGQREELQAAVSNLANVRLMTPVGREDLLGLYQKSDILFLHLNDYPAFRKVLPSKLFEYLATGKPVVAGVAGYPASFLLQVAGVSVFAPCHVQDAVEAFRTLDMRPVERKEFIEKYRRRRLMRTMAANIIDMASAACKAQV